MVETLCTPMDAIPQLLNAKYKREQLTFLCKGWAALCVAKAEQESHVACLFMW